MTDGSANAARSATEAVSGGGGSARPSPGSAAERPALVRSKVRIPRIDSMGRERLDGLVNAALPHGLTLVIAPAGSGKTTLLARWAGAARASGAIVAWYRAESTDATTASFLGYIQLAFEEALARDGESGGVPPVTGRPWRAVEEAAAWLERLDGRLLLIVDDLHTLAGSEAEVALGRFVELTASQVCSVAGSRSLPAFNVSRWRLSGNLLEITGDDLRFRSWEVERLFREHYREVLRGDELGKLARRTEGWAAGLQMFHLATRGKSPAERARLLAELGGSSRLIREYLARNLLDELPEELRSFLVETSPLRRLSGSLCDLFLNRSGSAALLEALDRHQVFAGSPDDGTYRYHEILQSYLEQILTETRGEAATRAASTRAAELLEGQGAVAEAIAAYSRADRWDDVARVLGNGGDRLPSDGSADWLVEVAPAVVRNDPWLRLGSARRLRAEGHWTRALEAFAMAEAAFGTADGAAVCRTERLALAAFLDPGARPLAHWSGALRGAIRHGPLGRNYAGSRPPAVETGDAPAGRLALGLASLAAGFVLDARVILQEVAADPDADTAVAAAAAIAAGAAGALAGDARAAADIERGAAMAERAGQGWLMRLARATLLLVGGDHSPAALQELRTFRWASALDGDGWGEVLAALVEGWALLAGPEDAIPALELAVSGARRLGSGTLEAWACALAALAAVRAGLPDAHDSASRAESLSRSAGVSGARVAVYLALATCDPDRADEHRALAEAAARETGLAPAWARPASYVARVPEEAAAVAAQPAMASQPKADRVGPSLETRGAPVPIEIGLFGGFAMRVGGRPVDLSAVKPLPRSMLRFLALNAGKPVHREVLESTFWPEADRATAARNVHVALSGLRKLVCPAGDGEGSLLVREGEAYRLALGPGARVDLLEIDDALAGARAARARKDREAEISNYRRAMELAAGDLLPEDGPADWVVYRREEIRAQIAGAARSLAELLLDGDPNGAADACAAGLRSDPHHDGLWRLLIAARERAGDQAAAATARSGYERMLGQLGLALGRPSRNGERTETGEAVQVAAT